MKFDSSIAKTQWRGPLGSMVIATTAQGLAGIWFTDQKHLPDWEDWPVARPTHQHWAALVGACTWLERYFESRPVPYTAPLDLSGGTAFQLAVWQALLKIPRGHTTSYGALAAAIHNPAAVRAVGAAVGRNPISILIPCHRVIGAGGALTGYAGGLERKSVLLQHEGALI